VLTIVITEDAMYVLRNIEARSYNDCCGTEAISIIYSECVFVALSIQHAMRMRHTCHLWPATLYNIFPRYRMNGMIFEKKKFLNINMRVFIFSAIFV
jgi:hypothetical protein